MAEVTEQDAAEPDVPTEDAPAEDATEDAEDAAPARSERVEAVRAPISDADPVGMDVKYEDSFQQLKAEVDKVQSANADADFERIVELGTQVLTKQSKDLTAAAYFGFGLIQTEGLRGLVDGIGVIWVLCETYWEDLYPPTRRMVARKNALQLFSDRARDWLEPYKPTKADREPLEQAIADFKALQALTMERMEADAPVLSRLNKLLSEKLRAVPKEAPPPPAAKESSAAPSGGGSAPSSSGTPSSGTPSSGASVPSEFRSPTQAGQAVLTIAAYLREQNKADPVPFRLARALRWGALAAPPPAEGGKTLIPPFAPQRKTYLSGLLDRAEFAELVREAETSFAESPFWFDLQRYLVAACDALGGPFAAIRDGVLEDLAGLVRRLPSVPSLTFSDGTPFADPETMGWIEMRVRPLLGGGNDAPSMPAGGEDGAVEKAYADARKLLADGDLAKAVATLSAESDASGYDRFRRRYYLATLCLRGGRPAVARSLLEGLSAEIDAHRLDAWMPDLAANVWAALHESYRALQRTAEAAQKAALAEAASGVFERLSAASPARALALMDAQKG